MIDMKFEPELYEYTSAGQRLHVLVVDDSKSVRAAIRERLELANLAVTEASCDETALASVDELPPDLVLLDLSMPGIDGMTLLKTLRMSHSKYQLPVISLTGTDSASEIVQALDSGANDYVTKPIDFDVLWARLSNQLMQRQATEYLRHARDGLEREIRQRTAELNTSNRKLKRVIQERLLAEDRLQKQANYDDLTGLPNRSLARDRLEQSIAKANRQNLRPCVAFLDLDNFKYVNDTLGHAAGDALLKEAARRLSVCARKSDTVARLGGDEFLMILDDSGERPRESRKYDLKRIGERIIEAFASPFMLDNNKIDVSLSIGFAIYPRDGKDVNELIRHADAAMYRAKNNGKNTFCCYSTEIATVAEKRPLVESQLRRALERDELLLHYQPIVDIRSGEIIQAEASLCWRSSDTDAAASARYTRVAEESGLIVPIGNWAIRAACEQVGNWRRAGASRLKVSVNVCSRQLMPDSGLCQTVRNALRTNRLPAEALQLEITEDALRRCPADTGATIAELEKIGIKLILDEFGSGNASISCLHQYPFASVKIGNSCIARAAMEGRDAKLVSAIIAMVQRLEMTAMSEGVDNSRQLDLLRHFKCQYAQGLVYSKPLSAMAFGILLKPRCSNSATETIANAAVPAECSSSRAPDLSRKAEISAVSAASG